ncbi:MAG: methyltransferase [Candidatus Aminicenantes bacterium 4484_214]|nr:MAG: methyltransferase [Candidatus Aminicenantes bacterium 4484_214]RLE10590.1 MAG: cobalamin-binding protein [Candidatus Aminicenantes bacterium]
MKILKEIATNLEKGNSLAVKELCRRALLLSLPCEKILNQGLIKGMEAVGLKFKKNEIFIPEVLIAARAMKAGLDILRPHLSPATGKKRKKIILGSVKGDLHDIGKKIVGMMLEKEGYEIIDLGIDVSTETFIKAIKKERPHMVGMSALLTTTMIYMREVIEAVKRAKLRNKVKIIVGGAPVTQAFADEIKADGYASNAAEAVDLVTNLLKHQA